MPLSGINTTLKYETTCQKGIEMPIFSYLALPIDGAKEALCADLATLPHCEVIPSDNREVVVLVTDTPDDDTENKLQKRLNTLQSLQSLSLTFGYDDKEDNLVKKSIAAPDG